MSTSCSPSERAPWAGYSLRPRNRKTAQSKSSPTGRDHAESRPSPQAYADERVPSAQSQPASPEPVPEDDEEVRQAAATLMLIYERHGMKCDMEHGTEDRMECDTPLANEGGPFLYRLPAQPFPESYLRTRLKNEAPSAASPPSGPPATFSVPDHRGLIQAEQRSTSGSDSASTSYADSEATESAHSETWGEQGEEE